MGTITVTTCDFCEIHKPRWDEKSGWSTWHLMPERPFRQRMPKEAEEVTLCEECGQALFDEVKRVKAMRRHDTAAPK